ncbi:MAG TPA: tryptophan--tRNA ligase [Candidatus Omnitrophota bacterium]|nr:tryptophan--tRNA ligase [Candidatus Omnitrophota bacterium]
MKQRVLSGVRPTGPLHLGHLLGVIQNWKKFENENAFYMIADWHALTTEYDSKTTIKQNVLEVALDLLAGGLDPAKCTVFVQSHVKEHCEMSLLLSMLTPLAWLERNPTYKDQIQELGDKELHTHGFLGYPVLQTADIILYKADIVPVGEDQLAHLELSREIVRRFHFIYGKKIFPEPQASLTRVPKLPGTDGRKMSKSYGNAIYLSDSPAEVDNKVKQMVTDPARIKREDKGHPEVCPVFCYHKLFNAEQESLIAEECRGALRGCVDCKREMGGKLKEFLAPIYERRRQFASESGKVIEILNDGARKARKVAAETMDEAKEAVGI